MLFIITKHTFQKNKPLSINISFRPNLKGEREKLNRNIEIAFDRIKTQIIRIRNKT